MYRISLFVTILTGERNSSFNVLYMFCDSLLWQPQRFGSKTIEGSSSLGYEVNEIVDGVAKKDTKSQKIFSIKRY